MNTISFLTGLLLLGSSSLMAAESAGAHCAAHEFAKKPDGQCQAKGECTRKPDMCTKEYMPVCSCDGKTYANRCEANAAGANIAHLGECSEASLK